MTVTQPLETMSDLTMESLDQAITAQNKILHRLDRVFIIEIFKIIVVLVVGSALVYGIIQIRNTQETVNGCSTPGKTHACFNQTQQRIIDAESKIRSDQSASASAQRLDIAADQKAQLKSEEAQIRQDFQNLLDAINHGKRTLPSNIDVTTTTTRVSTPTTQTTPTTVSLRSSPTVTTVISGHCGLDVLGLLHTLQLC